MASLQERFKHWTPIIRATYEIRPTPAPFDVRNALMVYLGIGVVHPTEGFGFRVPPRYGDVKPPTLEQTAKQVGATVHQMKRLVKVFVTKGVRAAVQMNWRRGRPARPQMPAGVYQYALS